MANRVRYFNAPAFTGLKWKERNPFLNKGEIGYELNDQEIPYRAKVGPGFWNSLPYMEYSYWDDETPVSTPIGDAVGDLSGKSDKEILDLMLNPYQAPAFSNISNNAGGISVNQTIFEIGRTWSGNTLIKYSLSNQANLVGATPINIEDDANPNIFSNVGDFAIGDTLMNLTAPLTPTTQVTYLINLIAAHTEGISAGQTSVKFSPKILWGVSQNPSILTTEWLTLNSKGSIITDSYARDYNFQSSGYHYLAIPTMLSPNNLVFTDVTNPDAPAGYGMEYLGQVTINNGVGSYTYNTYRSTYNITQNNSILRAA
jgi:hypothetical protein